MEDSRTLAAMDIYIKAGEHRLLNGYWKTKMKNEMLKILSNHSELLAKCCNDFLKKKLQIIHSSRDEKLFNDLKKTWIIMYEICKKKWSNIKQSWVSDLWKFVDNLLQIHYDYLILKNGADDVRANSFRFKGLRQDLAKFNEDWTDYSFGICVLGVTQDDYFQEVLMLLDFSLRLLKLNY